jgi:hypothetical protein
MKRIRDAQTIIGMLEGGEAAADLSREITETLAALKERAGPKGKAKGSITFKINIDLEGGAATLSVDIESKRPKKPRSSDFYWVLDDGSLSTEHPQQIDMFSGPRDVSARELG